MPPRSALNLAVREVLAEGGWIHKGELMKRTRDVVLQGEALRARDRNNARQRRRNGQSVHPRMFSEPRPLWQRVDAGHRLLLRATLHNLKQDGFVEQDGPELWRFTEKGRRS